MEDYNEYIELQSNMYQYYNDINTSHINISDTSINDINTSDTSISSYNSNDGMTNKHNTSDTSISSYNSNNGMTNKHNTSDTSINDDITNDNDKNNDDDIIDTSMLKPICENDLDFTNCVKSNEHNDINISVYYYKDYK